MRTRNGVLATADRAPIEAGCASRRVVALGAVVIAWVAFGLGLDASAQSRFTLDAPLDLARAVAIARTNHPDIRSMEQRAIAADRQSAIVSRPLDPSVFLGVDHVPFGLHGVDVSGGVEITAPLGGVLRSRRRAAEAVAEGRHEEVEQMALDVELEATMAFFAVRYARSLGALLDTQRALVEQLLAAANARNASGMGSQADVLRVMAERARVDALSETVEGLRIAAEGTFRAALGMPPGTSIPELAEPELDVPPSLADAIEGALEHRPELAARAAYVDGASADIAVMRGMYRPMIMTRIGAAHTMAEGPGMMGMLGFTVPIFRERLRAGVGSAHAMRGMAEADLASARLRVEADVARAYGDFVAAFGRRRAFREEVVPLSTQAVDATLAEYAAGRVPLVSPIEASRTLFASEVEALMADRDVGMSAASLSRARGLSRAEEP